jgi:hypothetical protein
VSNDNLGLARGTTDGVMAECTRMVALAISLGSKGGGRRRLRGRFAARVYVATRLLGPDHLGLSPPCSLCVSVGFCWDLSMATLQIKQSDARLLGKTKPTSVMAGDGGV